jgi:ATPase complex subunit ATP10
VLAIINLGDFFVLKKNALHHARLLAEGRFVFQVSFIDSWLLSSSPVKRAFLKMTRKSNNPQRHAVYAFGDHYDFRKELQIVNLLTG